MRSCSALLLAATLALAPSTARSQAGFPAGAHVRLTLADGAHRSGWVASADSATLRLATAPDEDARYWRSVPLASVRSYQLADGHHRGRGALVGLAVGGSLGLAAIGAGVYADIHTEDAMIPSEVVTLPIALATTALGTGFGALVAPTRWSAPIHLARAATSSRVRPWFHDGSRGIAITMRF